MDALADHEILVGTYEEYVLGFYPSLGDNATPSLMPSFPPFIFLMVRPIVLCWCASVLLCVWQVEP